MWQSSPLQRFLKHVTLTCACLLIAIPAVGGSGEDNGSSENCISGTCFGETNIFLEGVSQDLASGVTDFFCRLTGINVTALGVEDIGHESYFSRPANTVLFLNSLENAWSLNNDLTLPPDIALTASSFSGVFTDAHQGEISEANYLVLDALALQCNTARCVVEQTLNFLSQLYDTEILVDQDLYGDGEYCD